MSTPTAPAFLYGDYASFLTDYVNRKKSRTPSYSYKVLCRAAGLKSQSLVAMVAKGQRLPSRDVLRKLNGAMKLSPAESEYLEVLVDWHKAKDDDDRAFYHKKLRTIAKRNDTHEFAVDRFALIADWYHLTILEMICLADFQEDPAWIARRLGGRISTETAAEALARLDRLGLVKHDDGGRLRAAWSNFVTEVQIPDEATAKYHRQMLELALGAYTGQKKDERAIEGTTVTIDKSKLKEALAAIVEFRGRFLTQFACEGGDETFQLNVQFFRLTERA